MALFFHAIFRQELVYAPGAVYELLLAGEERVTLRTDFDVNIVARRTSGKVVAAGAGNRGFFIGRVNTGLHCDRLLHRAAHTTHDYIT
jgi:hypothetical protein